MYHAIAAELRIGGREYHEAGKTGGGGGSGCGCWRSSSARVARSSRSKESRLYTVSRSSISAIRWLLHLRAARCRPSSSPCRLSDAAWSARTVVSMLSASSRSSPASGPTPPLPLLPLDGLDACSSASMSSHATTSASAWSTLAWRASQARSACCGPISAASDVSEACASRKSSRRPMPMRASDDPGRAPIILCVREPDVTKQSLSGELESTLSPAPAVLCHAAVCVRAHEWLYCRGGGEARRRRQSRRHNTPVPLAARAGGWDWRDCGRGSRAEHACAARVACARVCGARRRRASV